MPHRRTFADAIVASAHSDRPALRHPAFADRSACGRSVPALKPAPGPWATPPDPMVQAGSFGARGSSGRRMTGPGAQRSGTAPRPGAEAWPAQAVRSVRLRSRTRKSAWPDDISLVPRLA